MLRTKCLHFAIMTILFQQAEFISKLNIVEEYLIGDHFEEIGITSSLKFPDEFQRCVLLCEQMGDSCIAGNFRSSDGFCNLFGAGDDVSSRRCALPQQGAAGENWRYFWKVRHDIWINGWMNGYVEGWVGGWMDGQMDRWVDGWMHTQMDGWVDGYVDGWMDGQMVGWSDGWIDR